MLSKAGFRDLAARAVDRFISGGVEIPAAQAGWLRAQSVEAYKRFALWVIGANLLNATLIVTASWGSPAWDFMLFWWATLAALMAFYFYKWVRGRGRPPSRSRTPRVFWICTRDAFGLAMIWAMMPVVVFPLVAPSGQTLLATVSVGMMCGGAFMLATIPPAAFVFVGTIGAGILAALVSDQEVFSYFLAGIIVIYIGVLFAAIRRAYYIFVARLVGEALANERAELIGILLHDFEDAAADWLWSTNADGALTNGSARFADLSPNSARELESAPFHRVFVDDAARGDLTLRMERQESFADLLLRIDAGNSTAWIVVAGKPLFEDGKFAGYRGVASDETIKRESETRIAYMAAHDDLTGLPNRTSLTEYLLEVLDYDPASKTSCALLLLDLDEFKRINDSLGHSAGDRLLVETTRRLRSIVGDTGIVARLGGDEFAVVLNRGAKNPVYMSQKIISAIEEPFDLGGATAGCSASVGIRQITEDDREPDLLLKHADLALYEAKAGGRRRAALFEPRMDAAAQALLNLEEDLRRSIAGDELELFFQPLVAAQTGQAKGCEALLRWRHPEKGLLTPVHFIDVAERSGLIVPLGEWVIRAAVDAASLLPDNLRVAVNISPSQLRSPNLLPTVINALASKSLSADRLELEITESVLLDETESTLTILQQLRALGVRISLDDFGTGYSSYSYLRKFQFDKIKIDKSFIDPITEGDDALAIVSAMVALARILKMETVAEGVELEEQLDAMRTVGCDQIQGYFFSRPVCLEELFEFLELPMPATPAHTDVVSLPAPAAAADVAAPRRTGTGQ